MQSIAALALVVPDYDEAIHYYTQVLGFELCEDHAMETGKRWVTVAPPGGSGPRLLLVRATNELQASRIGNQTGGRVFLFLHTDDFERDHAAYSTRGVVFLEAPRNEPYGSVAVFRDRYGNLWDLIQPASAAP